MHDSVWESVSVSYRPHLLELTDKYGQKVYLNSDQIVSFQGIPKTASSASIDVGFSTVVQTVNGTLYVRELPKHIVQALTGFDLDELDDRDLEELDESEELDKPEDDSV